MGKDILLHCCCAPCSLSCVPSLLAEGFAPTAYWYNPNIHPWREYTARRDCLVEYYADSPDVAVIVDEEYGLRDFVTHVAGDISHRCQWCYECRLRQTAKYAAEHGFSAFSTTLLASVYQQHDVIVETAERMSREYGVAFVYRDFRPNFRECNNAAREQGLYMQKYCGCVFSEEERYAKEILRDRTKYSK